MRTTLSLDPDVVALLSAAQKRFKKPFKQVVNEALRIGLQKTNAPTGKAPGFRTRSASLGRCLIGSIDDVAEVLAVAEGESFL